MLIKRIFAAFIVAFAVLSAVPVSFASDDHDHGCKADSDCEHGEHCKDGHCHE